MISTPAARICGPPIPKICTAIRSCSAFARRAAYMSPEASPAESNRGIGGIGGRCCSIAGRKRRRQRRGACEAISGQRFVELLLLILQLVQPVVNPALRQQFLVRALLAQAPFMENEDAVRILNRAQAVRNH